MTLNERELQQLYQRMTASPRGDGCLSDEQIIRAATETLDDAQRDKTAAHIARCSDCARSFRIARSLRPFEDDARRTLATRRSDMRWFPIAASVAFILIVPLVVWLAALQRRNTQTISDLRRELENTRHRSPVVVKSESPRPQIGVPIVDLDADLIRGTDADAPLVVLPPATDLFTLILHMPGEAPSAAELELVDEKHAILWSDRVPVERNGSITIALDRRMVPPGTYAIRTNGATFHFRVSTP